MASSSSDQTLSMTTLLHMLTIKFSSTNYLQWKNQVYPLLSHQKLLAHVDGSSTSPSPDLTVDGKVTPNPGYASWLEEDQRVLLLLQSSLTEEAMAKVIGVSTARELWTNLKRVYSYDSIEHTQNLQDTLRQLKKGTLSVSDYAKKF